MGPLLHLPALERRRSERRLAVTLWIGLIALLLPRLCSAAQGGPVYTAVPTYPAVGGACTTGRVQVRQDTGDLLCCVASQWAACGSAVKNSGDVASTITSSVASGSNALGCSVNGCRVDLGTGANDYFYSNGVGVYTAGNLVVSGGTITSSVVQGSSTITVRGAVADGATAIGMKIVNSNALTTLGSEIASFYSDNGTTKRAAITKDGAIRLGGSAGAAPTCEVGVRGTLYYTPGGTGVADSFLVCCKNAADSYAWQTAAACGT